MGTQPEEKSKGGYEEAQELQVSVRRGNIKVRREIQKQLQMQRARYPLMSEHFQRLLSPQLQGFPATSCLPVMPGKRDAFTRT